MAISHESKTEIVIFGGLAAFAVFLWWANRQAGAGTGTDSFPAFDLGSGASSPSSPLQLLSPIAPTPGITGAAPAGGTFNVAAPNLSFPGGAPGSSGCGCGAPATNLQFGGTSDLIQYLMPTPPPPPPVYYPTPTGIVTPQGADLSPYAREFGAAGAFDNNVSAIQNAAFNIPWD